MTGQRLVEIFQEAFDPSVWGLSWVVLIVALGIGAFLAWWATREQDRDAVTAEGRKLDLERRRDTVVQAIRALDMERDKLSDEDYERERRALLAFGAESMRELEGGAVSDDEAGGNELIEAIEAQREALGDARTDAIKALLAGKEPPAAPLPPPKTALDRQPFWGGVLLTVAVLAAMLFVYLGVVIWEGNKDLPASPVQAGRAPQAPPQPPPVAGPSPEELELVARLEKDGNDLEALNGLTDLEIRKQTWEKAESYNERALALAPKDPAARTWKALLSYRAGGFADAVALLDEVIADTPTFGRAHQFRGIIHLQLGQNQEALERFEVALELAPDDRSRFGVRQLIAEAKSGLQPEAAGGGAELSGTIVLGDGVDPSGWGPSASLFVSVKAMSGPPMPLRAKRLAPGPFPLKFSLVEGDSPMGGGPLPPDIIVTVKVDLDGNPMGDDPGAPKVSMEAKPGDQDLSITLTGS